VTTDDIQALFTDLKKPGAGEIHLWHLTSQPDVDPGFYTAGKNFLSAEERDRLASMKHPQSSARFLRGRILTRRVLGGYMSQDPSAVAFVVDSAGKPSVAPALRRPLAFSLSHADEETVLAVAADGDIGVDVEALTKAPAAMRVAREFYAASELQSLVHAGSDKAETALKLWTLKESIVKARGETVWHGLNNIALKIDRAGIRWNTPAPDRNRWRLAAGRLGQKLCLAVAWRAANGRIPAHVAFKCFDVTGKRLPDEAFTPVCLT
jgi:phosphopantetheinyl transferase